MSKLQGKSRRWGCVEWRCGPSTPFSTLQLVLEEEEDGEQEYEEGMYEEGEAPYDDEHEEGAFQQ